METVAETKERKRIFWKRSVWCNYIGVLVGILLVTPAFILLLDRRDPVQISSGTFIPQIVHSGQTVSIVWQVEEIRKGCNGQLERRIVEKASGKIHHFKIEPTFYHIYGPSDGHQTFSKEFTLPDLSDGEAEYSTVGERWCNLLQKYLWPIPFQSPRIPFTVKNPEAVLVVPPDALDDLLPKLQIPKRNEK